MPGRKGCARFRSHWPEIELLSAAAVVGPINDTAIYLEFTSTGHRRASFTWERDDHIYRYRDMENPRVINPTRYGWTTDR